MTDILLRPDLTFSDGTTWHPWPSLSTLTAGELPFTDDDYRLGPEGAIRRRVWPELDWPVGWD